jgi:hypothetical protein
MRENNLESKLAYFGGNMQMVGGMLEARTEMLR